MDDSVALRPLPRRALPPLESSINRSNEGAPNSRTSNSGYTHDLSVRDKPSINSNTQRSRRKRPPRQTTQSVIQEEGKEIESNPELQTEAVEQANESAASAQSKRARTRRRQANKSKSVRSAEVITNGHALTSIVSEEDVVPVDRIDHVTSMSALPGVAGSGANSQPQGKVYVQTTSGFTSHTNEWLASRQAAAAKHSMHRDDMDVLITKTSQVALSFHNAYIFFSTLLHGVLAGLAIWNVVLAFTLSSPDEDNFFLQYSALAQPAQTTFYILLVLCFVSALDRFNFAKPGRSKLMSLVKIEPGAWTVVAYFLAFMFNVGLSGLDFWIGRISTQSQLNETITDAYPNADPAGTLATWHALNVLRASFALAGWLLIAIRPTEDDTAKIFGEHVWSDEQREFTCNTKQPGCENVCFNVFTPVSNIRMWGLQMLAVSIPGAFYFVYVLHVVSRKRTPNENNLQEVASCDGNANALVDKKQTRLKPDIGTLHGATKRWKLLTSHVIPSDLQKSRARCIWSFYLSHIVLRIMVECVFAFLQYTVYFYRWTIPEVFQCSQWPCPHTVDCFISRPHEKTIFFRYMFVVSGLSVLCSLLELVYISWSGCRHFHAKKHQIRKRTSRYPPPPMYTPSNASRFADRLHNLERSPRMDKHEVKIKPHSAHYVSSSDPTSVDVSLHSDIADIEPVNRVSYL